MILVAALALAAPLAADMQPAGAAFVPAQYDARGDARFGVDGSGNLRDRQGRIVNLRRAERFGYRRDRDGMWRDPGGRLLYVDEAQLYRDRRGVLRDRYTRRPVDDRYAGGYAGQTWRGDDGRTYCRRPDGTTGLLIGGAGGALLGRAIDGGRNRALGTILGGAAGALAGRAIERGSSCR